MLRRDPERPIELGKYYLDRQNRVVGPIRENENPKDSAFPFQAYAVSSAIRTYTQTGRFHASGEPSHGDLVKGPLTKAQVYRERPSLKHLVKYVPKTRLTG